MERAVSAWRCSNVINCKATRELVYWCFSGSRTLPEQLCIEYRSEKIGLLTQHPSSRFGTSGVSMWHVLVGKNVDHLRCDEQNAVFSSQM